MKRFVIALLAMVLLSASCAGAQSAAGPACAQVTADLLDAPNAQANVLMRYYTGTRVEVIREADADYVQVNVGTKGGSLMGYMEKRDLAFGEKAIRQVRAEAVSYTAAVGTVSTLYSYPDKQAPVNDAEFDVDYKQVLGYRGGDWLHVEDGLGGSGFIARDELELIGPEYRYASHIYVEPAEDEMTREEAFAYAKKVMLASSEDSLYTGVEGVEITAEKLEQCVPECDLLYYYESPDVVMYSIIFRDPETGYVYAGIDFLTRDGEVVKISHGNG